MKGYIICFEGIDGTGKKTQSKLLMKNLKKYGKKAKVYSYPDYSSVYGKMIHQYLTGKIKLGRAEHFALFLMDIMKDANRIAADVDSGSVVMMDRYFFTALAYICPSGLDYEYAKDFVEIMGLQDPRFVFYLDMPTRLTAKRKMPQKGSLDKFEKNSKFLDEVKTFYGMMMKENYRCDNWIKIDASAPIDEVNRRIMDHLRG